AFGEDLEFPLAFGDLSIDALMVDTGSQTELQVFFHDFTSHAAHIFVANAAVIRALGPGVALFGEAEGPSILIYEIFLLEADPQVRVILNPGACVGGMRGAISVIDFAKNEISVLAARIRIESHRFEDAVRTFALGLHGGTAVKAPQWQIGKGGW